MNKPTLHYYFAHIFLKDAVINQWQGFHPLIKMGPQALKDRLSSDFNKLKEDPSGRLDEKDIQLQEDTFFATMSPVGDNKKLLILRFPPPRNTAEVLFVGILMGETPRYFTYELHIPSDPEKQLFPNAIAISYKVCEWQSDGKHLNYGSSESINAQAFVDQVSTILK